MTVMLDKRLLGTRDNLFQVCNELGVPLSIPKNVWQCINCCIWTKTVLHDELDDADFCTFCFDENNFKL